MLRAIIGGFLLGPVVLVAIILLWNNAAVVAIVVFATLAITSAATAIRASNMPAPKRPSRPVPPPTIGIVTLTSTPTAVRANASENLASANRWRSAFTGWRYNPPAQ
jgi:hypothetical protein